MQILYVLSRYPELSQTFIAREMQKVIDLGNQLVICRLRWKSFGTKSEGIRVTPARLIGYCFDPISWALGLAWALSNKTVQLKSMWHDWSNTPQTVESRAKLLFILLTVLALGQRLVYADIDHIHAHFLHTEAIAAMWLSRLLNIPYSITVQTTVMHSPRPIIEKVLREAAFCVATTTETECLLKEIQVENIHIIRSGIDLDKLQTTDQISTYKDGKSKPYYTILAVGRLVDKKGFDLLVDACADLVKQGETNFRCHIVGDGPERLRLQKKIAQNNLQDCVQLFGALPFEQVQQHFQQSDVFVMPSRIDRTRKDRDGLPNVIIEAMAMRIPVIASKIAGIPDLVIDGETGILVEPENVTELVKAIRSLLSSAELRKRLPTQAYKKVHRDHSITTSIRQLIDLMQASNQEVRL